MKSAVIIGATGEVGAGVTAAVLGAGYHVTAVGRSIKRLEELREALGASGLGAVAGSIANEGDAARLAVSIAERVKPDLVIVSVNGAASATPLRDLTGSDLGRVVDENLAPHLIAAKAFIPVMAKGGVFLGIGGGMADSIFPGMATISMAQAAQRMLYRYLAQEPDFSHVHVRELMLYSMIAGRTKAGVAEPFWITADEVGRHVTAVLADLETFEGPILTLKSRKQVGLPERKPAG